MKKTIALLLALLLVAGSVFAEVIDITGGGSHQYSMYLQAVVEDGGGLDDNNGDDPSDIKNGGLYIMVGYNNTSNAYGMGDIYVDGSLEDLGSYTSAYPLSVSLTPENAGDTTGTLQFYVAAQSNTANAYTTSVTFSSEGFKEKGVDEASAITKIKFTNSGEGYKLAEEKNGLTVTLGDGENVAHITVETTDDSHQTGYIYVARTDATWVKSSSYPAGTYEATIIVDVAAE